MASPPSVSVVFPAYNEAPNIERAIASAVEVLGRLGVEFEVIAVNDGSHDGTDAILSRLSAADPRVRWVHHPRNRGYGAALKSGIESSRMDLIFFTDADLQFDLSELPRLLDRAGRFDIIAGYRSERRDGPVRALNAWGWGVLIRALFDLRVRDIDCAFKLFHRRVFEQVQVSSIGAFVNSEILIRARGAGFTILQVPVSHYPRLAGRATGAHPRVVVRAFLELVKLYGELKGLPVPEGSAIRATSEANANR